MVGKVLRIAYAGTPNFAVPALRRLLDSAHEVCLVFTQPDRPSGRGKKLQHSPVKTCAQRHGVPVYQPVKMAQDEADLLKSHSIDLLVVAAYGQLVPVSVLGAPTFGCVNIHASVLPRWRGASPIVHAILSGDRFSGVSIMVMEAGLDTGPVLLSCKQEITSKMTQGQLELLLSASGADQLCKVVNQLDFYLQRATPQPKDGVTYAAKLQKRQAQISWNASSLSISLHVRAFNPAPMAYSFFKGERVRVLDVEMDESISASAAPGTVLSVGARGVCVACGSGAIWIVALQFPGGRPFNVGDFVDRWGFFSGQAFCFSPQED